MCVSIIIPVYNGEKVLSRCIKSILEQTYSNYEIIIIDDGSSDNSKDIIKSFMSVTEKIVLREQKNAGAAAARNLGLLVAKNEYIVFVDCDDYLDKNFLGGLVNCISSNNCEMVIAGAKYCKHDETDTVYIMESLLEQNLNKSIVEKQLFKNRELGSPWGKLYIKDIIDMHHIHFPADLEISEDYIFNLKYISKINNVYLSNNCGYNYIDDECSLSNKYYENLIEIYIKIRNYKDKLNKNYMNEKFIYNFHFCVKIVMQDILCKNKISMKRYRKNVSFVFNETSKFNLRYIDFSNRGESKLYRLVAFIIKNCKFLLGYFLLVLIFFIKKILLKFMKRS